MDHSLKKFSWSVAVLGREDEPQGEQRWRCNVKCQPNKSRILAIALCAVVFVSGVPNAVQAYESGKKTEVDRTDDAASDKHAKAKKPDPQAELKNYRMTFEAAQFHVRNGLKYLEQQQNQFALKEFQTALEIDSSCMVCRQELEYTKSLVAAQPADSAPHAAAPSPKSETEPGDEGYMETPPELLPLSKDPLTLKLNADSRTVFRTIAKLAGVNVIFDPEYQEKKINIDLVNVTIQQALSVASVEGKAFWKPIASNIIMVMPDMPSKRKEQEEQVLQKIYLEHIQTPQELTEIAATLQQMLELRHVQALPRDNAVLVRDTPAKLVLANKLIHDSDRGRPEVVVQISVLQVRRDRARSLGIQPGGSTTLSFNPVTPLGAAGGVALDKLGQISQGDFTVTIPSVVASALATDSNTRIIQNPEIRVSDGETARLRVGDRIPVATGSFQATTGIPVVNTQFQYIDVGVNIDLVPHVHPDHSVSMKLGVEVSSLNGQVNIGGVAQPIISQRRIDHEIRLQENEVSILGGLAERSQTKSVSGWPGLSRLPLLRYLFSGEDVNNSENEVLIVIHPRLVRIRDIAKESLRAMSVGTDAELTLRQKQDVMLPVAASLPAKPGAADPPAAVMPEKQLAEEAALQIGPRELAIKQGEKGSIQVKLENVDDLFSVSLLFKYDPQLVSMEDVTHGNFLSGGTQEIAIIQRIDKEKGEGRIFITRQPNTAGVKGGGELASIVLRRLADGPAAFQVIEVAARNSRQHSIPVSITQGTVNVR